tara:strand:+ start:507 stop:923 length:417 start_codon:yes stop_codon:yes gene_type:complete
MYAVVDVINSTVSSVIHRLDKVELPNGDVVFNSVVGYENPPQYDEDSPAVHYKILEITEATTGSGSTVVETSDPVFDAGADTVTITKTMAAPAWDAARRAAYGDIADQLDMQYHDLVDDTTTWKDHIAKVKSDNPKPG